MSVSDLILVKKHVGYPILDLIHTVAVRALHLSIDDLSSDEQQVQFLEELFVVLLLLRDLIRKSDAPIRYRGNCGLQGSPVDLFKKSVH